MRSFIAVVGGASVVMGANPIRRVVTLMQDMQKEIEAEGEKEEGLYKKFMCYCKGNTDNLSKAGEEAAAQIEELTAKVKAEKAEKQQVAEELKQHKQDRADAKQDLQKATKIRQKENEQFVAEAGDTKENIDATSGAIKALEKGMGAGAFIQTPVASQLKSLVGSLNMDSSDHEALVAFLEQSGDYIPQGGQIVGILKNMKDEMDKSLGGIVAEEEAAAASFEELKAAKKKEIEAATAAIENKTERVGQLAVSIVQNQNAAEDATKELGDSQKFLANLANACKEKTADWEERSKTRSDEIAAISEAISVLNDDDALDIFKKALPTPAALNPVNAPGGAFLQRNTSTNNAVVKARAQLMNLKFASPALNLLAHTVKAKLKSGVDFSSVLKMIDDMVALLKKEGQDDEKHKKFCDAEFDQSSDEKKATEQKLESLASAISEMKDEIASLKDNIAKTTAEIKALDKSVAEATEQRKQEHADYTEMIQLNEAAIQLIFKAQNRLQKFYNPAMYVAPKQRELTSEERAIQAAGGEVDTSAAPQYIAGTTQTVFIQAHQQTDAAIDPPEAPETYGEHKTKGQKNSGVVALLKGLTRDLEKEIQEAEHSEKTATRDYEELIADAQESRAQKVKSIADKESTKAEVEGKLQEAKTQHVVTSDSYTQIKNYIADLHASCDFIVAQFEVRKEARTQEVESLKNAKAVLSGANFN